MGYGRRRLYLPQWTPQTGVHVGSYLNLGLSIATRKHQVGLEMGVALGGGEVSAGWMWTTYTV